MKIKISVIIPVYDAESYLKRCLDSVINQSFSNLEIIIINDDSSAEILDEHKYSTQQNIVL
jgi:glycosyltransferase involved in cell wall biosynthesis